MTLYRKKPAVAQSQKLPQQIKNNTTSNQCEKKGKDREGITMVFQRKAWNLEIEGEKKSQPKPDKEKYKGSRFI